jgi:hypothetical protein
VSDGNEKSGPYDGLNRNGLPSPPRRDSFGKWPIVLAITATFSIIRLLSNVASDAAAPSAAATATPDVSASVVAEVSPFPSVASSAEPSSNRQRSRAYAAAICEPLAELVPKYEAEMGKYQSPEGQEELAAKGPVFLRDWLLGLHDSHLVALHATRAAVGSAVPRVIDGEEYRDEMLSGISDEIDVMTEARRRMVQLDPLDLDQMSDDLRALQAWLEQQTARLGDPFVTGSFELNAAIEATPSCEAALYALGGTAPPE